MKKPEDWHGFKVFCDLYDFGMSNMLPEHKQQWCKRADRKGIFRAKYDDQLKCHWNVCPKLKEERAKERKPLLKKKSILKSDISKKAAKRLRELDEMENSKTPISKCKVCGRKPEIYESSVSSIWEIYCEQKNHEIIARAKTVKTVIKRWNEINETV